MKSKDKIIFLDAGTVDYGDITFREIEKLGQFTAYDHTAGEEAALRRLDGARIVITNKFPLNQSLLGKLKTIECICVAATGVNNIDLEAARKKGIAVANVSGYSTESVVQATFCFLLALAENLIKHHQASHDGTWSRSRFFMLGDFPVREIYGKTLGILGYGNIGKRVAQVARAFGMKVLVGAIPGRKYAASDKTKRVSFEKMIRESDFLSVHAPLTDLTRDLIDKAVLAKMKKGACLLNLARGGIVNEQALFAALQSGRLAGAATDVLTKEPPPADHILIGAPNLIMTPHIAWASYEARVRLIRECALNIQAFQQKKKRNRVV